MLLLSALSTWWAFNPFTARVFDGVLEVDSNFWVYVRNPMMWPFKWKFSVCTFTWCHLFLKILENEIWNFGRNLLLATFGSERVNTKSRLFTVPYLFVRSSRPSAHLSGRAPSLFQMYWAEWAGREFYGQARLGTLEAMMVAPKGTYSILTILQKNWGLWAGYTKGGWSQYLQCWKNKLSHVKVLLKSFHLNGNTVGFHPQTQKLELHTK